MPTRTLNALLVLPLMLASSIALAEGAAPPAGWGEAPALPPANGQGQVTFKQGGAAMTLPLNQIELDTKRPDMVVVTLAYVDRKQENKLDLTFVSMPKLGKNDPRTITGFLVKTKALGVSRQAGGKTRCDLTIVKLGAQEVSGTLSCKGMTDLSAQKPAPDVTDVKFEGKLGAK
jgi:hypothetical protein